MFVGNTVIITNVSSILILGLLRLSKEKIHKKYFLAAKKSDLNSNSRNRANDFLRRVFYNFNFESIFSLPNNIFSGLF